MIATKDLQRGKTIAPTAEAKILVSIGKQYSATEDISQQQFAEIVDNIFNKNIEATKLQLTNQ